MERLARQTLLLVTIATLAFSQAYAAYRLQPRQPDYYDMLGRLVMEKPKYVYSLDVDISEQGKSDLWKYQDIFWDRLSGSLFFEDVWFNETKFLFAVDEETRGAFSPLTFNKVAFDGIHMRWDYRGLTLDSFWARTSDDVISENDEWDQAAKSENNYLTAFSIGFPLEPINLYVIEEREDIYLSRMKLPLLEVKDVRFNFVDQIHNNSAIDYLDARGNAEVTSPTHLYVRVSPLSTNSARAKAYVYATNGTYIKVKTNGAAATALDALTTSVPATDTGVDSEGESCVVLEGDASMTITVPVANETTIEEVLLTMRLSGSFIVQIATEDSFMPVAPEHGVPFDALLWKKDVPRATAYTMRYGVRSSLINMSLSFDVLLFERVRVRGEFARMQAFRQYPTSNQAYYGDTADAVTLFADFSYPIIFDTLSFIAQGDFHAIDEHYTTTFYDGTRYYNAVDDNDDGDDIPGTIDGASRIKAESLEFPPSIDKDGNGKFDYNENILRMYADNIFFFTSEDRNNNFVSDEIEDDAKPDYPFNVGNTGFHARTGLAYDTKRVSSMFAAGYVFEETALISDAMMRTWYGKVSARFLPVKDYLFELLYELKYAQDTIADEYINESGDTVEDPLFYRNSVVNTIAFDFSSDMKPFSYFVRLKYLRNDMLDETNALNYAGLLAKVAWTQPVSSYVTLNAAYKIVQLNNWSDEDLDEFDIAKDFEQSMLVSVSITPSSIVVADVIYSFYSYVNLLNYLFDYTVHTFALQVTGVTRFQPRNQTLAVVMGLQGNLQAYAFPDATQERDNSETFELYLKILSRY